MWLKVKPEEPLILGGVRAGSQFLTTVGYIPGRVLRGAWAEWLLMQGRKDIISVVKKVRIGNLFPAAEWREVKYALPLPLSALSCKKDSGFQKEPNPENRGHGVVDTLLPHLAYKLLEEAGAEFPAPFALNCTKCDERMEPLGGFYAVYRDGPATHYVQVRERYHAQTKVALSRFRRAAVERMLYTANALSPYTESPDSKRKFTRLIFLGRVWGKNGEDVQELVKAVNHIPIGALHTRGYGRVRVEVASLTGLPDVKERLEQFNRILTQCWADLRRLAVNAEASPDGPDGLYFCVDLLAPGVFRHRGIPTLIPVLGIGGRELEPIWWMTRPDFASGWSTAWGLPKPANLAARMGSVYVYRWEGDLDSLIPALERLEAEGIGERCDEGFGECLVCHPFHQEVKEV